MKISPMIKTVTCITYSALILLSIIILWCVFSSTVESFGDKCYSSGGSTCPSPKTPETPDTPTTPTTPKCSEDGGDSPDEDSPDSDEILCPAAENDVAKTSEYVGHNGRMCEYLKDKGEKKCNERHVVDSNTGEKIWCKWDNGECIKGGSCNAEGGSSEPTIEEGKDMIVNELMNESAINTLINKVNARHGYTGPYFPPTLRNRWTDMAKNRYVEMRGSNYGKTHEEAYDAARNWICFGNGGAGDALSDDCSPLR